LLVAKLSSQFGDGVFQAFLVNELVFLSPENQSTAAGVAKAFAVLIIPFSLVGPLSGVVIDRWSRRRILAITPLVRAAVALTLVPIAGHGRDLLLYLPALVVVSANRFYLATAGAVLPALVPDEDLLVANSLAGATGTVMTFAGLVIGTQLADPLGSTGLILLAAATWPIGALAAWRIAQPLQPKRPEARLRAAVRRVLGELVQGARRLAASPPALGSIVSVSFDQFLIGIVTVLSVVIFKEEFKEGVASYGRIIAAGGAGVLVGTATVGLFENRVPKPRIVSLAFAIAGIVALLAAIHVSGPTILLVAFVLGLTFPWRKVPADTIVQESIPDRYRGRVFAFYDMAFAMPRVLAASLTILLILHLSTGWIVAMVGLMYLAWTPVLPWWVRRRRWARLRFYEGGRADEVPRAIVIGGEEVPVDVVASRLEDREGVRIRRFVLRTADELVLDVLEGPPGRYRIVRERPVETPSASPSREPLEGGRSP